MVSHVSQMVNKANLNLLYEDHGRHIVITRNVLIILLC